MFFEKYNAKVEKNKNYEISFRLIFSITISYCEKNDIALQKICSFHIIEMLSRKVERLDSVKPWQPLAFLKREKVLHSTHFGIDNT